MNADHRSAGSLGPQRVSSQGQQRRSPVRYILGTPLGAERKLPSTSAHAGADGERSTSSLSPASTHNTFGHAESAASFVTSQSCGPSGSLRPNGIAASAAGNASVYDAFDEQSWLQGLGWQIKRALSKPVSAPTSGLTYASTVSPAKKRFIRMPWTPSRREDLSSMTPVSSSKGKQRASKDAWTDETPASASLQGTSGAQLIYADEATEEPLKQQYGFYRTAATQTTPPPSPPPSAKVDYRLDTLASVAAEDGIVLPGSSAQGAAEHLQNGTSGAAALERARHAARAVHEMLAQGGVEAADGRALAEQRAMQLDMEGAFKAVGGGNASAGGDNSTSGEEGEQDAGADGAPSSFIRRFVLPGGHVDVLAALQARAGLERDQQPQHEAESESEVWDDREAPQRALIQEIFESAQSQQEAYNASDSDDQEMKDGKYKDASQRPTLKLPPTGPRPFIHPVSDRVFSDEEVEDGDDEDEDMLDGEEGEIGDSDDEDESEAEEDIRAKAHCNSIGIAIRRPQDAAGDSEEEGGVLGSSQVDGEGSSQSEDDAAGVDSENAIVLGDTSDEEEEEDEDEEEGNVEVEDEEDEDVDSDVEDKEHKADAGAKEQEQDEAQAPATLVRFGAIHASDFLEYNDEDNKLPRNGSKRTRVQLQGGEDGHQFVQFPDSSPTARPAQSEDAIDTDAHASSKTEGAKVFDIAQSAASLAAGYPPRQEGGSVSAPAAGLAPFSQWPMPTASTSALASAPPVPPAFTALEGDMSWPPPPPPPAFSPDATTNNASFNCQRGMDLSATRGWEPPTLGSSTQSQAYPPDSMGFGLDPALSSSRQPGENASSSLFSANAKASDASAAVTKAPATEGSLIEGQLSKHPSSPTGLHDGSLLVSTQDLRLAEPENESPASSALAKSPQLQYDLPKSAISSVQDSRSNPVLAAPTTKELLAADSAELHLLKCVINKSGHGTPAGSTLWQAGSVTASSATDAHAGPETKAVGVGRAFGSESATTATSEASRPMPAEVSELAEQTDLTLVQPGAEPLAAKAAVANGASQPTTVRNAAGSVAATARSPLLTEQHAAPLLTPTDVPSPAHYISEPVDPTSLSSGKDFVAFKASVADKGLAPDSICSAHGSATAAKGSSLPTPQPAASMLTLFGPEDATPHVAELASAEQVGMLQAITQSLPTSIETVTKSPTILPTEQPAARSATAAEAGQGTFANEITAQHNPMDVDASQGLPAETSETKKEKAEESLPKDDTATNATEPPHDKVESAPAAAQLSPGSLPSFVSTAFAPMAQVIENANPDQSSLPSVKGVSDATPQEAIGNGNPTYSVDDEDQMFDFDAAGADEPDPGNDVDEREPVRTVEAQSTKASRSDAQLPASSAPCTNSHSVATSKSDEDSRQTKAAPVLPTTASSPAASHGPSTKLSQGHHRHHHHHHQKNSNTSTCNNVSLADSAATEGRVTRSHCRFHHVTLERQANQPSFIVPGCTLLHEALAEEGAVDKGEATGEQMEDKESFQPEDLANDLYHALTRIVGSEILDEVYVLRDRLPPGIVLEDPDGEPSTANKAEAKQNDAQIEAQLQKTPPPISHDAHDESMSSGKRTRSSEKRHRHPSPDGDQADYLPPETPSQRISARKSERNDGLGADISFELLEERDMDAEMDDIELVGRKRKAAGAKDLQQNDEQVETRAVQESQIPARSKRLRVAPSQPEDEDVATDVHTPSRPTRTRRKSAAEAPSTASQQQNPQPESQSTTTSRIRTSKRQREGDVAEPRQAESSSTTVRSSTRTRSKSRRSPAGNQESQLQSQSQSQSQAVSRSGSQRRTRPFTK